MQKGIEKITETEKILKRNLTHLRETKNITRYALAKLLAIDANHYRRYEDINMHVEPHYSNLEKIALYYEIEVYELFKP